MRNKYMRYQQTGVYTTTGERVVTIVLFAILLGLFIFGMTFGGN